MNIGMRDSVRRVRCPSVGWHGLAILIALTLFLASRNCSAITLEKNQGIDASIPLTTSVSFLSDPSNTITLTDILAAPGSFDFKPAPSVFSAHDTTLWLRFTLIRGEDAPADWVIHLSPPWLDDIRVYVPDISKSNSALLVLGDQHRIDEWKLGGSQIAFPVSGIASEKTVYLRISSHGSMPLRLQAWQPKGFEQYERRRAGIYLFFAGGASVMVLLAFLFWIWTRTEVYFWNFVFLTTAALAVYIAQGYGNPLLSPMSATLSDRFTDAVVYACMFSSQAFTSAIFNFRHHFRGIARVLDCAMVVLLGLCILALLGISGRAVWYVQILGLALGVLNAMLVAKLLYRHFTRDHIFLAVPVFIQAGSWGLYLVMKTGVSNVDYPLFSEVIVQIAQLFFFLLLNAAIAWRAGDMKVELVKEKARREKFERTAAFALEEKKRQSEFVSVVSHEIRSPLNAVDAISHALLVSEAGGSDQVSKAVGKIRTVVARISNLVDNILLSGALESDQEPSAAEPVDLNALVRKVLAVGSYGPGSHYELRECKVHAWIQGDPAALEIALSNIYQNAIKYSDGASAVTVSCSVREQFFLVDVCNAGHPIPAEEHPFLFNRYFRGKHSSRVRGTGLGLHISQTIAQQHRGDVTLISSTEQGTIFRLALPIGIPATVQSEAVNRAPRPFSA